jgi:lysine/ornithine N-monooxygenase
MKEYSQIQKCISVLMIFILLAYLSGCQSTRIISKFDLPIPDSTKYAYIVHSEKSKFLLDRGSTISKGILYGKINKIYDDEQYDNGKKIHLYTSSNSVISIDTGRILSVPLNEVTKVEFIKVDLGKTIVFIAGYAIGVFLVVGLIILNSNAHSFD